MGHFPSGALRQIFRAIRFADYTYDTAEGDGVAGTIANHNFTLGAAYPNPSRSRFHNGMCILF